ncbi:hypothetical protein PYW07_011647 [Mythimna separata]|uniref:Gamma-glutamylcyclotransferase family protein n=1 Tax=Mythimna separata TaxID=271217 RepID=A0AAD7Y6U5_MYTSE|nr:hypothetical protein PYW07_011647 [Mythimna separata]
MFKLSLPVPKLIGLQLQTIRTMTHKIFVYGTLKRGEPNYYWLTDKENGVGKFVSDGRTKTRYPLIIATKYNIPFLLYKPGSGHNVMGEIFEVDDTMLSKLDILEDHPKYYIREIDEIMVADAEGKNQESMKCWVYFLKNFKEELLSRPQFESYSATGPHGLVYMDSNNESVIEDLDEDDVLAQS